MSCCVICFRVGIPDVNCERNLIESEEVKLKIFNNFIKLLNRHLNINSITKNEVNEEIVKAEKDALTAFTATLGKAPVCNECLEVISSFCELYHKIKVLELLINNKMGTLMNIMFCAGKVPARVACFKEAFIKQDTSGSSGDELFDRLLQHKNRLIAKCSKKLASVSPQLIVERVSSGEIPSCVVLGQSPPPPVKLKSSSSNDLVRVPGNMNETRESSKLPLPSSPTTSPEAMPLPEDEINPGFAIEVEDVKPSHPFLSSRATPIISRSQKQFICSVCEKKFAKIRT